MQLLDRLPVDSIPPEGCVLVIRPAQPEELRKALRDQSCQSAVGNEDQAGKLSEMLDTWVRHQPDVAAPELAPGHCHYLATPAGGLYHLSARPA